MGYSRNFRKSPFSSQRDRISTSFRFMVYTKADNQRQMRQFVGAKTAFKKSYG